MREQAIHSIRYKHTFEVLLDFLNQYEWKSREIRLMEFQSYLSDQIWSADVMRWEKEEIIRNRTWVNSGYWQRASSV